MTHTIADIHYAPAVPSRLAPLTCSCGWEGLLGAWDAHKHPERQPSSNEQRALDGQRRREGRYGLSPEELSIRISEGMLRGKRRRGQA